MRGDRKANEWTVDKVHGSSGETGRMEWTLDREGYSRTMRGDRKANEWTVDKVHGSRGETGRMEWTVDKEVIEGRQRL